MYTVEWVSSITVNTETYSEAEPGATACTIPKSASFALTSVPVGSTDGFYFSTVTASPSVSIGRCMASRMTDCNSPALPRGNAFSVKRRLHIVLSYAPPPFPQNAKVAAGGTGRRKRLHVREPCREWEDWDDSSLREFLLEEVRYRRPPLRSERSDTTSVRKGRGTKLPTILS